MLGIELFLILNNDFLLADRPTSYQPICRCVGQELEVFSSHGRYYVASHFFFSSFSFSFSFLFFLLWLGDFVGYRPSVPCSSNGVFCFFLFLVCILSLLSNKILVTVKKKEKRKKKNLSTKAAKIEERLSWQINSQKSGDTS